VNGRHDEDEGKGCVRTTEPISLHQEDKHYMKNLLDDIITSRARNKKEDCKKDISVNSL